MKKTSGGDGIPAETFQTLKDNTVKVLHSICIIKKTREFKKKKKIYFCFIVYAKAFVWITTDWKILKEIGIPDHLTCLLRNL